MAAKIKKRFENMEGYYSITIPLPAKPGTRRLDSSFTLFVDVVEGTVNVPATGDFNGDDVDRLVEALALASHIAEGKIVVE